jgi:hypothetical protein
MKQCHHQTAASNDCHRIAEGNVIIRQQQAMTVIRFQEARASTDIRKQCHQTAGRDVITRQSKNGDFKNVSIHCTAVNTYKNRLRHTKPASPLVNLRTGRKKSDSSLFLH